MANRNPIPLFTLVANRDHAMISWSSHPEVDKKRKVFDDSLNLRKLIRVVKSSRD